MERLGITLSCVLLLTAWSPRLSESTCVFPSTWTNDMWFRGYYKPSQSGIGQQFQRFDEDQSNVNNQDRLYYVTPSNQERNIETYTCQEADFTGVGSHFYVRKNNYMQGLQTLSCVQSHQPGNLLVQRHRDTGQTTFPVSSCPAMMQGGVVRVLAKYPVQASSCGDLPLGVFHATVQFDASGPLHCASNPDSQVTISSTHVDVHTCFSGNDYYRPLSTRLDCVGAFDPTLFGAKKANGKVVILKGADPNTGKVHMYCVRYKVDAGSKAAHVSVGTTDPDGCSCDLGDAISHATVQQNSYIKLKLSASDCSNAPCLNSGACIQQIGGYTCQCTDHYTGDRCQFPKDICGTKPCKSSTEGKTFCKVNLDSTYVCMLEPTTHHNDMNYVIIGAVLGGVALLVLIGLLCYFCRPAKREQRRKTTYVRTSRPFKLNQPEPPVKNSLQSLVVLDNRPVETADVTIAKMHEKEKSRKQKMKRISRKRKPKKPKSESESDSDSDSSKKGKQEPVYLTPPPPQPYYPAPYVLPDSMYYPTMHTQPPQMLVQPTQPQYPTLLAPGRNDNTLGTVRVVQGPASRVVN